MRHPTLLIVCLLALLLAAPAAARGAGPVSLVPPAGAGESLDTRVRRALELGERRFGPACPGGISVTWAAFEVDYLGTPGARAWARTFAEECLIEFNVGIWLAADWREAVYDWPWLCTLVVHEYGHLAGHGHADDPADIMHATIERVAPECDDPAPPPRSRATAPARAALPVTKRLAIAERLRRSDRVKRARRGARRSARRRRAR
jgi:hypothetical protein